MSGLVKSQSSKHAHQGLLSFSPRELERPSRYAASVASTAAVRALDQSPSPRLVTRESQLDQPKRVLSLTASREQKFPGSRRDRLYVVMTTGDR